MKTLFGRKTTEAQNTEINLLQEALETNLSEQIKSGLTTMTFYLS